jgi:hypothetical protein
MCVLGGREGGEGAVTGWVDGGALGVGFDARQTPYETQGVRVCALYDKTWCVSGERGGAVAQAQAVRDGAGWHKQPMPTHLGPVTPATDWTALGAVGGTRHPSGHKQQSKAKGL